MDTGSIPPVILNEDTGEALVEIKPENNLLDFTEYLGLQIHMLKKDINALINTINNIGVRVDHLEEQLKRKDAAQGLLKLGDDDKKSKLQNDEPIKNLTRKNENNKKRYIILI